ncbi:hypothetical protein [Rhizobium leguminosarum]|uniref:hypothetical protein n=1 Tax=Rhizobium leguminosarum TaxID=384 RepID=UPI001618C70B|nr:hypothetical protein [Rhizobium leguminosarum]MBB4345240.1 hypothetical protein [Rhizobium leguminosarum]MBB6298311.1 hypothetical protein [Rhizobium leguminosarum]
MAEPHCRIGLVTPKEPMAGAYASVPIKTPSGIDYLHLKRVSVSAWRSISTLEYVRAIR